MEINNMIRDPNQNNQSSVFQSVAYPGRSDMWCENLPDPKLINPTVPGQIPNAIAGYTPVQQHYFSPTAHQIPSPMCFGSSPQTSAGGQFHFQFNNYGFSEQNTKLLLGKRKSDLPPLQPCKQLITDEKMAEHMSKLHINSETQLLPIEPDSVKNKRLYMCEEMRKLQDPLLPLLPPSLLKHQPCTALVLWQPPQDRIIPSLNSHINSYLKTTDKDKLEQNKSKRSTNNLLEDECLEEKLDGSMELDS